MYFISKSFRLLIIFRRKGLLDWIPAPQLQRFIQGSHVFLTKYTLFFFILQPSLSFDQLPSTDDILIYVLLSCAVRRQDLVSLNEVSPNVITGILGQFIPGRCVPIPGGWQNIGKCAARGLKRPEARGLKRPEAGGLKRPEAGHTLCGPCVGLSERRLGDYQPFFMYNVHVLQCCVSPSPHRKDASDPGSSPTSRSAVPHYSVILLLSSPSSFLASCPLVLCPPLPTSCASLPFSPCPPPPLSLPFCLPWPFVPPCPSILSLIPIPLLRAPLFLSSCPYDHVLLSPFALLRYVSQSPVIFVPLFSLSFRFPFLPPARVSGLSIFLFSGVNFDNCSPFQDTLWWTISCTTILYLDLWRGKEAMSAKQASGDGQHFEHLHFVALPRNSIS